MTISVAQSARRWLACVVAAAAAATALSLSSPAVAADMLAQPRPPAVETPLWTGFYLGVHGGGGWGSSRVVDPNFWVAYNPITIKSSGALAGAQMGANWQFGSVVVGGELDLSWANIKGNGQDPTFITPVGFTADFRALATGTGRVGYATGNFLGYAKAGLAWANIDFKSFTLTAHPIDVDHQRTGVTAGAGLEMALLGNLSARLEYDFIYFGATAMGLGGQFPNASANVDHQLHLLKAGLNWRFSGDYLLARY